MIKNSVEIRLLPNGQICFGKGDPPSNEKLLQLLTKLESEPANQRKVKKRLKNFFEEEKKIKRLIGDKTLCG